MSAFTRRNCQEMLDSSNFGVGAESRQAMAVSSHFCDATRMVALGHTVSKSL